MAEEYFICNHGKRTVTFQNFDRKLRVQRKSCIAHRLSDQCVLYMGVEKNTFETVLLTEWYTTIKDEKNNAIKDELSRAFNKAKAIEHVNLSKYICYSVASNERKLTISIVQEFIQGSTLSSIFLKYSIPCGILHLEHIALGCLRAIQHLHANNLTCNGLDPSKIYIDHMGDVRITTYNLIGIADNIILDNSDNNIYSKANDIICFGKLMISLINGNVDAKEIPTSATANLRSFLKSCSQKHENISATDLLLHPFLNKDHPDYSWPQRDGGTELPQLTDLSSMEFIRYIDKGAFGKVILVRKSTDRKQYALKLIPLQENNAKNDKIMKEVVLLSDLIHINVVRYFTSGIKDTNSGKNIKLYTDTPSTSDQGDQNCIADEIVSLSISFRDDNDDKDPEADMYNGTDFTNSSETNAQIVSSTGRELYILMEYCEKTIKTAIEEGLHLESERIWRLFRETLNGLMYVHRQKLIHRDLKPKNIFLDSNDRVKIGDFGLATKTVRKAHIENAKGLTHEIVPRYQSMSADVGTTLYVAPELLIKKAKVEYNNKIDMYSLGIIFFEMCYKFETNMERCSILSKLREENIELPDNFGTHCTDKDDMAARKDIIELLLNHDPSLRPTCEVILQREHLTDDTELQRHDVIKKIVSKPNSPDYTILLNTCFKQVNSDEVKRLWNDSIYSYKDEEYMLIMDFLTNKLIDIFKLHGYHNLSAPLFLLDYKHWTNCLNMQLMTQNGIIVSVPFDLRLPFAQYVGKTPVTSLRRFTIERVFREEELRIPREYQECAFDIVSSTPDLIYDIEILLILCQIIKDIPVMNWGNLRLRVNHPELVKAILQSHGISVKYLNSRSIFHLMHKHPEIFKAFQQEHSKESIKEMISTMSEPSKMNNIFEGFEEILEALQYINQISQIKVVISPNLLKNIGQYSGMMYQLQFRHKIKKEKPIILAEGGRYDGLIKNHQNSLPNKHVVGMTVFLETIRNVYFHSKTNFEEIQYNEMLINLDVIICSLKYKSLEISARGEKVELLLHLHNEKIRCRLVDFYKHEDSQKACKDFKVEYAIIFNNTWENNIYIGASVYARNVEDISGALNEIVPGKLYTRKIKILFAIIKSIFKLIYRQFFCRPFKRQTLIQLSFPLTKEDWIIIFPLLNINSFNFSSDFNADRIILHSSVDLSTCTLQDMSRHCQDIKALNKTCVK